MFTLVGADLVAWAGGRNPQVWRRHERGEEARHPSPSEKP